MATTVSRTLRIYGYPADKENWQVLRNALKRYQCAMGACAGSLYVVELAGATITQCEDGTCYVSPPPISGDDGKEWRTSVCRTMGLLKNNGDPYADPVYATLREELPQDWISAVAASSAKIFWGKWFSKDPEFTKVSRRFAAHNRYHRPLRLANQSMPIRNKPNSSLRITEHSIFIRYSTKDDWIEIKWPKLDKDRWLLLRKIVAGDVAIGDPISWSIVKRRVDGSNRKKDRIGLFIPYKVEVNDRDLDRKRVLEVAYDDMHQDQFLSCKIVKGVKTLVDQMWHQELSAEAALAYIDQLKAASDRHGRQLRSCGSKRDNHRGRGHIKAAKAIIRKINGITDRRTKVEAEWNHIWSARLVELALGRKCGTIRLMNLPSYKLFDRPWNWSQLRQRIKDKATEEGIKFEDKSSGSAMEDLSQVG